MSTNIYTGKSKYRRVKNTETLISYTKKRNCPRFWLAIEKLVSFDTTSDSQKRALFEIAKEQFAASNPTDFSFDWKISSSEMDVDMDGNLTGFMSCDEYYEWKREKERSKIQNSLIEEEERNEKIRTGMKCFLFLI